MAPNRYKFSITRLSFMNALNFKLCNEIVCLRPTLMLSFRWPHYFQLRDAIKMQIDLWSFISMTFGTVFSFYIDDLLLVIT